MLKFLNAIGAAADVENAVVMAGDPKGSQLGQFYEKKFKETLEEYKNTPGLLYDAPQLESRLKVSTEGQESDKIPFPIAKEEEFVQDHRLHFSGDYGIDSGIKYFRGP
jgi:hypothetical protein